MQKTVFPFRVDGTVAAIPSKSELHRQILCAALSGSPMPACPGMIPQDIRASLGCGEVLLGAMQNNARYEVPPRFPCGESGTTLRLFLPAAAALGIPGCFETDGRLLQRGNTVFFDLLRAHGAELTERGPCLTLRGKLRSGTYCLPGNISSQFISGLLFALPLLNYDSDIMLTTDMESKPYINMTLQALEQFGIKIMSTNKGYHIPGGQYYRTPRTAEIAGDWSNAAFFLCAGALGGRCTVTGLNMESLQGDRQILALLAAAGAKITTDGACVTAEQRQLQPFEADAADTPDLVPPLAVLAAGAVGTSVIRGCGRLRYKESDRLESICALLNALGGCCRIENDSLIVVGSGRLRGGIAPDCADHRIVMAGCLCGILAEEPIILQDVEYTAKSDPDFFRRLESIQKQI